MELLDLWAIIFSFSSARYDTLMQYYTSPGQHAQLPDMVQYCHGLLAHSSFSCVLQTGFFSPSAQTDTEWCNHIKPELKEALQMPEYGLKKALLDFTGMWVTEEEELEP